MTFASEHKKSILILLVLAGVFIFVSALFEFAPAEYKSKAVGVREPKKTLATLLRINSNPPPFVLAESVFVERLLSHEVIFAKNEDKTFAPASLAKLMTALLYVEGMSSLDLVSISEDAKSVLQSDEKRSRVDAGQAIKSEDLLKLMVAESDNDAAYAAADVLVQRRETALKDADFEARIHRFVFLMNQRGEVLGLKNTNFTNPAGKDEAENYSSARDLARIAEEIFIRSPQIWDTSRIIEGEIYSEDGGKYHFENTDVLLKEFPALFGSKTGFTDEAAGALILLYELAPRDPIVVVILKSNERFNDGRAILRWLDDSFRIQSK
ncbi:MAG: serine hydrolase [bacterium]|nr:serine hydrolase [bacterium]